MFDRLEFVLSEAFTSLRRNTWMTFAAITTAAMALFLLGGLGYSYLRLSAYAAQVQSRFEMKVFLKDGVKQADVDATRDKLLAMDGVSSVRFVSKEDGLKRFMEQNPGIDISGLEMANPLPDAFEVTLRTVDKAPTIAKSSQALSTVLPEGVQYEADVQNFLAQSLRLIRLLGIVLGGVMLLTSGVLIYNAIRLTIMARRRELRIMQLVGATRATVWTPLLIEGVVQGAIGGTLATLVLWSAHEGVQSLVAGVSGVETAVGTFPLINALLILTACGAAYGLICSAIAVREPRRRRRRAV